MTELLELVWFVASSADVDVLKSVLSLMFMFQFSGDRFIEQYENLRKGLNSAILQG